MKILANVVFFILAFGTASSAQSFELVKAFPMGNGPTELGVLNPNSSDQDPTSSEGLVWNRGNWWILDNANKRLSMYDHDWVSLRTLDLGAPYHFNIVPLNQGLVLWNGYGYMRTLGGVYWIPSPFTKVQSINKSLGQFANSDQEYSFLFQYKDVLIFQNVAKSSTGESASYFGIKGLATGKEDPQSYLDEAKVRSLLADPANTRYKVQGNLILDKNQVVSADGESVGQFFHGLGAGDWTQHMGDLARPAALANGCYWFTTQYGVGILDGRGQELVKKKFYDHLITDVTLSDFTPAPDGYLYQLRGDWANQETRLYRIGPFPEIKLDYHGTGGSINDDHVNLRENPTTQSAVVTQVDKGTPMRVLDKTEKPEIIAGQTAVWYHVRLWDRTEGWVFGAFIDVQK